MPVTPDRESQPQGAATARIADRDRGEPLLPTLPMGGVVPHQNPLHKLRNRDRPSTLNGGEELGYLPLVVHQNWGGGARCSLWSFTRIS